MLETLLILPKYGSVEVELTIYRDGTPKIVKILSSQNTENELFIRNRLLELSYPCFNEADSFTLHMVFRNDFKNIRNLSIPTSTLR